MLDKKKIKEKLEQERTILLKELGSMGKLDSDTLEWDATPEPIDFPHTDQNDMADRFEDFESRSSVIKTLQQRFKDVTYALKELKKESFGKCEVCKKDIEVSRLEANPAARTCKKHLGA